MAAIGAVRHSQDGTAWTTAGFLVRAMPNRASLATIVDHEDGQFVYLIAENVLTVWANNQWVDVSGKPPAPDYDASINYPAGSLVYFTDGEVYRAPVAIAANRPAPDGANTAWERVVDGHHIYQLSTAIKQTGVLDSWYMLPDLHTIGAIIDDGLGGEQWEDLLSEQIIRSWIAEGAYFRGTLEADGSTITGATEVSQIPAPDQGNTGTYWVAVEPLTFTNAASQDVDLSPGDWLMSDGTDYVRVPGGQLTRALADTLYKPIDERPKVQVLLGAGETPDNIDPNAPKHNVKFTHDYEVYHGSQAPQPQEARLDQATGIWQFHRMGAANTDMTVELNQIQPGDTLRATGENQSTQAMDQIMEMDVQTVNQAGDIWTFTGTLTQTVTLFPGGDYIDGSTCLLDTDRQTPYGHEAKEDDVIINFVEGHTWIYGRDPMTPGLSWITLPSIVTNYIVSNVAGETPILPGTTQMPAILRPGDRFINEADNAQWIYYEDSAGTAKWRSVSMPETVLVFTATGETPAAPPTPLPTNLLAGDTIINTTDQAWWLYDGVVWHNMGNAASGRGTVTYVGPGTFDLSNIVAPNFGMPVGTLPDPSGLEPEPNDVYIDSSTGDYWVMS